MKKKISLLFFLIIHLSSLSQKSITTDGPCTDAMAMQLKGRWIKTTDPGSPSSKEAFNLVDNFHSLVLKIYPQPIGVDGAWHRSAGISYFGAKRRYSNRPDGTIKYEDINLPHSLKFYYRCGFFRHYCDYNNNKTLMPGYPGETATWLTITANEITGSVYEGDADWTINGLPVKMKPPVFKTINGYELQYGGSNTRYVLVHRKGILPYINVTRKQYLDYCIIYHTRLYDEMIKAQEQMPARTLEEQDKEKKARLAKFEKDFGSDPKRLKSAVDYYISGYQTDQQQREERVNKIKQVKREELKKFTDELEKTTKDGLLDSPAVVLIKYQSSPIFETDPLKGFMLVTENPGYIRKDLPRHVPQVFVVWWTWQDWAPQKEIGRIIEQDFPFEKLQAMIDK
ncbi:MAG: hypothetical protein ACXWWC_16050 [Chitinophagaceae bacterium]